MRKIICVNVILLIVMILGFVCCSNPSGSTNNNTLDSCDICDGVQDESHEHDYCLECDGVQGSDHEHQEVVTPTEPTYDEYFHITTIGGENSPYKVAYPDNYEYNELNDFTAVKKLNDYQKNYKKYIESLTFSDEFKSKYVTDITFNTFGNYNNAAESIINVNENFDYLIGTVNDDVLGSINDVCAPVFKDITNNLDGIDKDYLYVYYKAIKNEAKKYDYPSNTNDETSEYTTTKKYEIKIFDGNSAIPFDSFYLTATNQSGNASEVINPQVAQELSLVLQKAADKMGVKQTDLENIVNLSFVGDTLEMVHDCVNTLSGHNNIYCCDNINQMTGIIENEKNM